MMKPVINLEETIGKTVGRRLVPTPTKLDPREKTSKEQWRNAGFGFSNQARRLSLS